jgi:hypothetical protein
MGTKANMFRIIHFFLMFLLFCPLSLFPRQQIDLVDSNQKKLVGQAIFPEKEYNDWLVVQKNPPINPTSKIKCTIDTFLILKYESLKKGTLYDFGFLFNLSNEKGEHEYANERGLLFLRIVGWRALGNMVEHYNYRPNYKHIAVQGERATVHMASRAQIVLMDSPDQTSSFGWGLLTISLVKIHDSWLIHHLDSTLETYTMFPRETDFLEKAIRILKNNFAYETFDLKHSKILQKRQEQAKILYAEISGEYEFVLKDGKVSIVFGLMNKKLVAKFDEYDLGIQLIPFNRREMAFSAITPTGKIYNFRFFKNCQGNITECQMDILDRQYIGLKTKNGSGLDSTMDIFPGINKHIYDQLEAELKSWDTDPRMKEIMEKRRERQKEQFAKQRKEEEKRIQTYKEISGEYRFEIKGKLISISFFVQDRYLMGIYDESSKSIVLQRIRKSPLEFEFRPYDKVVYTIRFQRDEDGDIKKCFIQIDDHWYKGEKKNTAGEKYVEQETL